MLIGLDASVEVPKYFFSSSSRLNSWEGFLNWALAPDGFAVPSKETFLPPLLWEILSKSSLYDSGRLSLIEPEFESC